MQDSAFRRAKMNPLLAVAFNSEELRYLRKPLSRVTPRSPVKHMTNKSPERSLGRSLVITVQFPLDPIECPTTEPSGLYLSPP